jgi:hypothetical protein
LEQIGEPQERSRVLDSFVDLAARPSLEREREGHIVADRHVRIERVVLEDHRDVALLRRNVVDDALADPNRAAADVFEPSDHSQGGCLAATRRAYENHELAVVDFERERRYCLGSVREHLADALEDHLCHQRCSWCDSKFDAALPTPNMWSRTA